MQKFIILSLLIAVFISPVFAQQTPEAVIPWQQQARYNVLVLGMDRRPDEADTLEVRTDAIMVVSIDNVNNSLGILSIPRDIYVSLPNGAMNRINSLLFTAENTEEGSGIPYLIDVMQYNLGMYIDAVILFDFSAFEVLVDAVDGIEIDVPYLIVDSQYPSMDYRYEPLRIEPGLQILDGEMALKYARTRHQDDDYERGRRQLQIIEALAQRLREDAVLDSLLLQAPRLITQLNQNVYSNLELLDLVQLGTRVMQIPPENITAVSIERSDTIATEFSGMNIRIIDGQKLPLILTDVFGNNYNQ